MAASTVRADVDDAMLAAAQAAFDPARVGLTPHRAGWLLELPGHAPVAVASIGWPHAQVSSFDRRVPGSDPEPLDTLALLGRLQALTWGFPPEEIVPANLLAVVPDTGGATLLAYDVSRGCNADGWLGFVIGLGARSGTLVSHMLGVRAEARGALDLGWRLKLLQAHLALATGHAALAWTYDPMRGASARLNLEKLGATVESLTIDKYGALRSSLYGESVPSDRFGARWDLLAPRVHTRVAAVAAGTYQSPTPSGIAGLPELTPANAARLAGEGTPRLRFRVPGDVDALMRDDPARAIAWRGELRATLGHVLATERARPGPGVTTEGPVALEVDVHPGGYAVVGFASGLDPDGARESWYVLERKGNGA